MHSPKVTVAGEFRLFGDPTAFTMSPWCPNSIVNSGYDLLGQMVAGQIGGPNYVYLEFANSLAAGSIPVPEIDVTADIGYYRGLASNFDYLRLALEISPSLDATSTAFHTNRVTFYAVSSGNTGNRTSGPLAFSYAEGSVIYGIAIVYAPDPSDPSKDILFSRGYSPQNMQKAKPQSGQVTMMWRAKFE